MITFFRWMASVFDDAGLTSMGDRWRRKVDHAEAWKHAFAGWWVVRWMRAPTAWGSAWLARHPYLAIACRVLWLVAGTGAIYHFGVDRIAGVLGIRLTGMIGVVAFVVAYVATLVFALRVGGNRLWRPAKAAAIVGVKGGEKPDQRAEQNTATATVGVRWSEGVGIRLEAAGAGNAGRA